MTAFPMVARCAAHQLDTDEAMLGVLQLRDQSLVILRPNLMLRTGPQCTQWCTDDCPDHHGMSIPILSLRAG